MIQISILKQKRFWYVILSVCLFLLLLILVCNQVVIRQVKGLTYNSLEEIPVNKVGLVLGTSPVLKSGMVNPYFQYRVEATVALFKAQKITCVLVSGDNGRSDYNEPQAFKDELVKRGIPESKIILDYAGFRTLDSMVRAKEIFGQTKLTVISQKFHNERAIFLAKHYDIEAVGFNARDLPSALGIKTQLREYLARTKLFFDILFSVSPKFLGEKIQIED